MKKFYLIPLVLVFGAVTIFGLFFLPVFPPMGQGCLDQVVPGGGCTFHDETAFQYFILNRGTISDLVYNWKYNQKIKQDNENLQNELKAQKDSLPVITEDDMRLKFVEAKKNYVQNITLGKFNDKIVIVIRTSDNPPEWQVIYAQGSDDDMNEGVCLKLKGQIINYPNGQYRFCAPIKI